MENNLTPDEISFFNIPNINIGAYRALYSLSMYSSSESSEQSTSSIPSKQTSRPTTSESEDASSSSASIVSSLSSARSSSPVYQMDSIIQPTSSEDTINRAMSVLSISSIESSSDVYFYRALDIDFRFPEYFSKYAKSGPSSQEFNLSDPGTSENLDIPPLEYVYSISSTDGEDSTDANDEDFIGEECVDSDDSDESCDIKLGDCAADWNHDAKLRYFLLDGWKDISTSNVGVVNYGLPIKELPLSDMRFGREPLIECRFQLLNEKKPEAEFCEDPSILKEIVIESTVERALAKKMLKIPKKGSILKRKRKVCVKKYIPRPKAESTDEVQSAWIAKIRLDELRKLRNAGSYRSVKSTR